MACGGSKAPAGSDASTPAATGSTAAPTKAASDYIDNSLIEYNKTKKYDAILDRAAGLYFNPALDITDEVVKALNEAYNKAQEDKK